MYIYTQFYIYINRYIHEHSKYVYFEKNFLAIEFVWANKNVLTNVCTESFQFFLYTKKLSNSRTKHKRYMQCFTNFAVLNKLQKQSSFRNWMK